VTVDWVSRAITKLRLRAGEHGRTFHLVARSPTSVRDIYDVATEELGLAGIVLAGPGPLTDDSPVEQAFRDGIGEYWPYLAGAPRFRDRNTARALPNLSPPLVDRARLRRLIRFAIADQWGRATTVPSARHAEADPRGCAHYFEQTFPQQAQSSDLARAVGLDVLVSFDIHGGPGGQWSCQWRHGEFFGVRRGLDEAAAVVYRLDVPTFQAVIDGRLTPHEAFFAQQIAIDGDLELALKLAALFEQFLHENRATCTQPMETMHVLDS
jgi:hypothetical protein